MRNLMYGHGVEANRKICFVEAVFAGEDSRAVVPFRESYGDSGSDIVGIKADRTVNIGTVRLSYWRRGLSERSGAGQQTQQRGYRLQPNEGNPCNFSSLIH